MAVIRFYSFVTLTAVFQHFGGGLTVDNKKLHHHMSSEELRRVFHVDRHDLVPEYEVVMVHAVTPYTSYKEDNIGPPNVGLIQKQGNVTGPRLANSNLSDIWSVLSAISRKTLDRDLEKSRRGPDNVEEIEETEIHDKVMKLSAFGKDLELKLKKTSGLFGKGIRMWETLSNSSNVHGIEYRELPQEKEEIGELYQDEKNQAALLVHTDQDGGLLVEGTIGHNLVVKPVPSSVRHLVSPSDDEMFLDEHGEDFENDVTMDTGKKIKDAEKKKRKRRRRRDANEERYHGHIVFKRSRTREDSEYSDYAFMEPDSLVKKVRKKRGFQKREAPYVIFPEILVIVDYDGYRLHGGDNVQIKRYFVSFWNGVDLRYKLLKGPKIRISIAGIIISRGRDATPYLERNRVGRDAIDSAAALTDMGKYLFRERRLPVYDIAVAITKLDMCRRQFANDACNRGTAGFAYVGGACVVNKRLEKVNSVAIIEDTGGFSGIIVAAHEVGHLLGAVHDGSPPPSYLGGPGAEKCRWEDGFIMSDLRHTEKGFKWSSCSVASFHHFLNGDTATCLFNSPHEDESLPRVLPGKLLSLDAQCRKDRGTSACFKDDRVCSQLFCFDSGSGYCVAYRPAAEGSPCGDGQYCINGRCVAEHENIIPDYSQNGQYFRRDDSENFATQPRPIVAYPNSSTQRNFPINYRTQNPFSSPAPFKTSTYRTSPKTQSYYSLYNNPRTTAKTQSYYNPYNNPSSIPKTQSYYSAYNTPSTTPKTQSYFNPYNSYSAPHTTPKTLSYYSAYKNPNPTPKSQSYYNPDGNPRSTPKSQAYYNSYNNPSSTPKSQSYYNPYITPTTSPKPVSQYNPFITHRTTATPQSYYNSFSTPRPTSKPQNLQNPYSTPLSPVNIYSTPRSSIQSLSTPLSPVNVHSTPRSSNSVFSAPRPAFNANNIFNQYFQTPTPSPVFVSSTVRYNPFLNVNSPQKLYINHQQATTKHPYDISHLYKKTTTKNPYDFSDFGNQQKVNNVHVNPLAMQYRSQFFGR